MTCDECRAAIATAEPLALLDAPAVREHCTTCGACQHAVAVITDGHREAALVFLDARSSLTDSDVIERAIHSAERRQRGRIAYLLIAVVLIPLAAVISVQPIRRAVHEVARAVQTEQVVVTIPLTCLDADRAGDLITAYLRSNGSVYYAGKAPLRVITIRGTPAEVQRAREVLAQYDRPGSPACAAPVVAPSTSR